MQVLPTQRTGSWALNSLFKYIRTKFGKILFTNFHLRLSIVNFLGQTFPYCLAFVFVQMVKKRSKKLTSFPCNPTAKCSILSEKFRSSLVIFSSSLISAAALFPSFVSITWLAIAAPAPVMAPGIPIDSPPMNSGVVAPTTQKKSIQCISRCSTWLN